jgi:hypothetical protein
MPTVREYMDGDPATVTPDGVITRAGVLRALTA